MKNILAFFLSLFLLNACIGNSQNSISGEKEQLVSKLSPEELENYSTAYFASGCFWCVEAVFESVKGVKEAVSGYAGGHTDNPTYRSIGGGTTGHAESIEVYYDAEVIDYIT
ncbi:MAG: peptide-methionine (S)-S-oxide reductase, partial [Flavobacteriales bacterium]|nr:peptide-methionine (S)-S-oxide reductase [Flavobacteriales bacterium]